MRNLYLILILFLSIHKIYAQRSYSFEKSQAAYQELSGSVKIPFPAFDPQSDLYLLTELNGETFYFYKTPFPLGQSLKTLHVQSNGNLRIDNDSALVIIDGVFTYLDSIDHNSSVSRVIDKANGDVVLKVQWKNMKVRVGKADNYCNFQIWLSRNTGIVEIRYGPRSANNSSGFNTSSGPQVGMFFSKDDFTRMYEKIWVNGSPANYTLDSSIYYTFKAMQGIPEEGTVYRFLPRFPSGVEELTQENQILIYPNPVQTELILPLKGSYRIYNSSGQLCISAEQERIDVRGLNPGLYVIRNDKGASGRFIKTD